MKKMKGLLAIVLLMVITGCGGNGSTTSDNDSTTAIISTSGGSITTPSGDTTLTVPAGALDSETTITIGLCSRETPPGNLVGVYEFSPDGQTFSFPVTISIKYDPDSIPASMDPSDLRLAYLSGNGTWEIIPGSTVDTINHIISGQTSHFSTYSMVSEHKLAFGTEIVGFNSVNLFSNGSENYLSHENNSYNSYTTGMKWRSEEYVNRFYWQVYGKQIELKGVMQRTTIPTQRNGAWSLTQTMARNHRRKATS